MGVFLELFIIGATLVLGPCLLFCSPVVISYITATQTGWKEGLRAVLIFSFARLLTRVFFGLLAGMVGRLFIQRFSHFEKIIFSAGGIFILIVGLFIIFGKKPKHFFCQSLVKRTLGNAGGLILLGLTVGFLPCVPLLGVLLYIALKAQNAWQGAFYGFSFGAGEMLSPLILFGALAGALPTVIKNPRVHSLLTRLCGFLLFFIGAQLAISRLLR